MMNSTVVSQEKWTSTELLSPLMKKDVENFLRNSLQEKEDLKVKTQ